MARWAVPDAVVRKVPRRMESTVIHREHVVPVHAQHDRGLSASEAIPAAPIGPLDLDEVLGRILITNGCGMPHEFAYVKLADDNEAQAFVVRRQQPERPNATRRGRGQEAAITIRKARLRENAQALARVQERQRLARDLYDAVRQTLFSASMIAESLPRLWERDPRQVGPRLTQLHRLTRGAMAEMRILLLELYPSALAEARLDELLRHLTDALQGRTTIDVTLTVRGQCRLPRRVQTALYHIAQEALDNCARHASASRVDVRLRSDADRVELVISDDGRGFDADMILPTATGLGRLRERAESVGAALSITSRAGQGTRLTVVFIHSEQVDTDERFTTYSDSDRRRS